jgi:CheY-like chemotaxis protein
MHPWRPKHIRLLIVDDHPAYRRGLELLAGNFDIEIMGEADIGERAAELATSLTPNVILMDLRMPALDGIEATRRLSQSGSTAAIVVLTMFEDDDSVSRRCEPGARRYLARRGRAAGDRAGDPGRGRRRSDFRPADRATSCRALRRRIRNECRRFPLAHRTRNIERLARRHSVFELLARAIDPRADAGVGAVTCLYPTLALRCMNGVGGVVGPKSAGARCAVLVCPTVSSGCRGRGRRPSCRLHRTWCGRRRSRRHLHRGLASAPVASRSGRARVSEETDGVDVVRAAIRSRDLRVRLRSPRSRPPM